MASISGADAIPAAFPPSRRTPGRHRVRFSPGCGAAGFATQWWKGAGSERAATIIKVPADTSVTAINAAVG